MSSVLFRHALHKIPRAVITWAGFCPWTNTYCFGSEKGQVGISPGGRWDLGKKGPNWTKHVSVTSDPVNSIAFLGPFAAVSSRNEIVILRNSKLSNTHFVKEPLLTHKSGAHGVLAVNAAKGFVAPIGAGGLVCITPRHPGQSNVTLVQAAERSLNFYKLTSVAVDGTRALLAAACRKGGIAAFWLTHGQPPSTITRHVFGKGDIVDVVAVNDPRTPRGVIGLSKDGSLVWIPDVLASNPPLTHSPRIGIDTAYSLLLVKGHGLILASDTLSCLPDLVNGLVAQKESNDGFTLPLDGDELLPAPPDSFFLLTDGQPREFEIGHFIRDADALRDDHVQKPELLPKRPYLSELYRSEVSEYGYQPSELDWSREPDALFVT